MLDTKISRKVLLDYLLKVTNPAKVREELLRVCMHDYKNLSVEASHLLRDVERNSKLENN